ncbi:hypothetical protein ACU686_00315 [Yinghuangia aomiensis]
MGETRTFGADGNEAVLLGADGTETPRPFRAQGRTRGRRMGPGRGTASGRRPDR